MKHPNCWASAAIRFIGNWGSRENWGNWGSRGNLGNWGNRENRGSWGNWGNIIFNFLIASLRKAKHFMFFNANVKS